MQKREQEPEPTLFYKYFEDTLNYFKSKILVHSPDTPYSPPPIDTQNHPLPPSASHLQTPLQQEQHTFETSLESLKKISPQIKGTKLDYMIQRFDKEHVYMYV
jgi:hypothetical protein